MPGLAPKSDFLGLEDCVYLAAGGETPPLRTAPETFRRFLEAKSSGPDSRAAFFEVSGQARERLARMMRVPAGDITFLGSCSEAINLVCWSLPWEAGDNVVLNDLDYPTMIYPFATLESRFGVEVRVVRSREFEIGTADFEAAIDSRTRLVAVSHVSYLTGLRHDIQAIARAAHREGAAVLSDVSHSLGVVPLDLGEIDFSVSCAYKWLLGIHGLGVFHWNRRLQTDFEPLFVGEASVERHPAITDPTRIQLKPDAARATVGNQSWISLYALIHGLDYLESLGERAVYEHVQSLTGMARESLLELGLPVMTPADPARRAANLSFLCEEWESLARRLAEAGILVWCGQGRVRVSPFVYNDENDLERLLDSLKKIL